MEERIIKHPLRDIVLHYDESIPETAAEKRLTEAYVSLHDECYKTMQPCAKLIYEYKELEYKTEDAIKEYKPFIQSVNTLLQEAKGMEIYDKNLVGEIQAKQNELRTTMVYLHEKVLEPLKVEQKRLEEEFFDQEERINQHYEHFSIYSKISLECIESEDFEHFSLDIMDMDKDDENFREHYDKSDSVKEARFNEIQKYNQIIDSVNVTYQTWEDIKLTISNSLDDTGKMDCSLSESFANGTGDISKKPLYFIPPGDKLVKDFKLNFGMFAKSDFSGPSIVIGKDNLAEMNPNYIEQMFMSLQHYPLLIEKMLYSIHIIFKDEQGNPIPDINWKGHEEPIKYLNLLYRLPCSLFFFNDRDVRSYILMGNLITENKSERINETTFKLEGEILETFCDRVYDACWYLMVFCYNSDFDPKEYIQIFLDELELPFVTYEMLKKDFDKDLKEGINITVTIVDPDKK